MAEEKPDYTEAGRRLFAREAGFYWAAAKKDGLPPPRGVEIAFAGRSNVGKSSLINALTGRNALARTSHTPGRTQELNFFNIADTLSIIDMPGYGFAAVGKSKVQAWTGLIHDYLRGRVELARVFLLIDARHGLKTTDDPVLRTLRDSAVSYQVVLTKADQLSAAALADCEAKIRARIAKEPSAHPQIIVTSSKDGVGIEALRASIVGILFDRHAAPEWLKAE